MMKKKIAIGTLGCRLNKFESDSIETDLKNKGYEIVNINEYADAYIINTCTVTNKSDAKSRNMIRKAHRLNPDSILIVAGCYADTDRKKLEEIEGISYIIGNKKKAGICKIIEESFNNKDNKRDNTNLLNRIKEDSFNYTTATKGKHTRSFIKIQDGCNVGCTYCKIPLARGEARSRSYEDILFNIKSLYEKGFKEFILTGINIGYYNYEDKELYELIKAIYEIKGDFRIRLSSIEPDKLNDSILDCFNNEKMGQHLHIPLQSGSDKILKLMGRKYTTNEYIKLIDKIKTKYPNINISTDIIIGFPGETEEDFRKNIDIIKRCKFSHIHTFKYSKRNDTPAASMPLQVEEYIKSQRSKIIRDLSTKLNNEYKENQLGRSYKV
ncbi:MAG: tRNA (N(6)-L-threonylcarbamoyladenosine(37)-C(2))-methylthiotransferase MtaB [Spirochaetota bacterium]